MTSFRSRTIRRDPRDPIEPRPIGPGVAGAAGDRRGHGGVAVANLVHAEDQPFSLRSPRSSR
jgi:hypothetical protein